MLCQFLLQNFYLLISGYYMRAPNDLCTNIELISTQDECYIAGSILKDSNSNIILRLFVVSIASYPKGCYKTIDNSKTYWNSHHSGSPNLNAHPICKKGQYMEITNVSLLNV